MFYIKQIKEIKEYIVLYTVVKVYTVVKKAQKFCGEIFAAGFVSASTLKEIRCYNINELLFC